MWAKKGFAHGKVAESKKVQVGSETLFIYLTKPLQGPVYQTTKNLSVSAKSDSFTSDWLTFSFGFSRVLQVVSLTFKLFPLHRFCSSPEIDRRV